MPNDPFVILGINRNATQNEILDAYKQKRTYYSERVFEDGEAGAEAARMLEQLDDAYQQAMEYSHETSTVLDEEDNSYDEVKSAISAHDAETAQRLLDNISNRDGEWHYYQSIVFYEKNWLNESKTQLEIALRIDPQNEKYKRALNNLKKKIDGAQPFNENAKQNTYGPAGPNQNQQSTRSYQQQQATAADGLCAACEALWCADCCCECMGGDLIRCC